MPIVPARNIMIAFDPSFLISGRSILMVKRTRLDGRRYLDATKYSFD
jgi:hypothetical protein